MLRGTVAIVLIGFGSLASAQVVTLAEVKANKAVQLSGDDLKQMLPGAKVVSVTSAGSTRRWENNTNGTFVASSDGKGVSGGRALPGSGNGTWSIGEQGTYCVKIQWTRISEEWCRYIFKAGDKYYGFGKLDDGAQGSEFEFAK